MKRIVVIEDSDAVREEIVAILTLEGYEVTAAENGRVGVEAVRHAHPDLVLCDLTMPVLDGYGTLQAVRADPSTATVPFVCLTARAERPDMRRAMELGADDYISKPFTVEDLLRGVVAALGKKERAQHESHAKLSGMREALSASMPHEIRTPLTTILGYAEMLTEPDMAGTPEEVSRRAQHILDAGIRLTRLTENFLLHARLQMLANHDAGLPLLPAPITIGGLVVRVARERAYAYRREQDLRLDVGEARIGVDPSYFGKLVDELIDNACKFSRPGTPVRVMARQEDGATVVVVTDRGCGMTREQIAEVEDYVQFERVVHEQQGVGLGLSLARRIAALVDGTLSIESAPGRGTTVSVRMPTT